MTSKRLVAAALTVLIAGSVAYADEAKRTITVLYADLTDDPYYDAPPSSAALNSGIAISPFPAAELAIKDAELVGEAVGVDFVLQRLTLENGSDATAAIAKALNADHAAAVLLDLPLDEVLKAATDLASRPVALFNVRHRDTTLRQAACHTHLFHTIPSWDMLEDALAQVLTKRNWKRVLVVASADPEDTAVSAAFQSSAAKFGLTVVANKSFVTGEDPRDRDKNNPRLITGDAEYDVVFVADHQGDFSRNLPYNTFLPRPVIGASGLVPSAWHPLWDRDGAVQLQHRFAHSAKRPMTELDWAVWTSTRAVVEAVIGKKARDPGDVLAALTSQDLTLELYKGEPGSFRTWNNQLRQPLLLATDGAVLAVAPVEGMLHRVNTLDTLGLDEPEFHCP